MALTNRNITRMIGARPTVLVVLALWAGFSLGGSATRALGDDEKAPADVLKALTGTWVSEDENTDLDSRWTFEGKTLKATVNGVDYDCKVKIDPKAKPHAAADFVIEDGPEDSKGKTSYCIYKLDGEKLMLCVSLPGRDRPKEFESAEGEAFLFKLKKEKAGKKKD